MRIQPCGFNKFLGTIEHYPIFQRQVAQYP
jgi:hypothetical protein